MKKNSKKVLCAVGAMVVMAVGFNASATNIYNDTSSNNGHLLQLSDGLTIGNEVSLSGVWSMTNFSFEYYIPTSNTLSSALSVEVKFYLNDGTPVNGHPTPGTVIYDSGLYFNTAAGNLPTGSHDVNYYSSDLYSGIGLNLPAGYILPSDFTFAISFNNVGNNTVYLPLANNQVGPYVTSYGDYWLYSAGSWSLLEAPGNTPANFLVNIAGVPEPSVFYLGAIGSAILFGVRKLKRKS